jgi:large subunit ribosomal protein L27
MAHKKAGGANARQGGNVSGKRLGIKVSNGCLVNPGQIIVRQRGKTFTPGKNTSIGRDFTIYSKTAGAVSFRNKTKRKKVIDVIPLSQ